MPPTHERALRGVPWTMLAYAVNRGITVLTTIALARLLTPADFGLVALATLAITLISLFSGLGLGAVLVLRRDLDERAMGTMLTLLVAAGVVFGLILLALAPLAADIFSEPRLTDVVAALAALLLFSGVNWFYESILQRELAFRNRFLTQAARTLAYGVVALGLAVLGAGVWSLVVGQLASLAVYGIALIVLAPYRVAPRFHPATARDLLRTSRGFVLQGVAAFFQQNVDFMAVGSALGARALGFYSVGYRQSELPSSAVADPIATVTFPHFAQMRERREDVMPAFRSTLRLVALACCPLGVMLSAAAAPFTLALFGEKWRPMIGPLAVLGLWGIARPLELTLGWLLNSIGQTGTLARMSLLSLIPLAPGVFVAARLSGITAVAWIMLTHMTLLSLALMITIARRTSLSLSDQLRALAPLAAASVVAWIAARAVVEVSDGIAPGVVLAEAVLAAIAAYAAMVRWLDPRLLQEMVRQARRALRRVPAPATPS